MSDQKKLIWLDNDIKFDMAKQYLQPQRGEKVVWTQTHIEDCKGNQGETGTLSITNMRLVWYKTDDQSQSLSVGDSPKIFKVFNGVYRSFEKATLYRAMKIKGADIIQHKDLILLPLENIISRYDNIMSIGSDQSVRGILYFSNIRIVWFAINNESFNISIPWIEIKSIRLKSIKQGPSMIIDTFTAPCGYQAQNNLESIVQEAQKLMEVYQQNPIYGVEYDEQETQANQQQTNQKIINEEIQIVDSEFNDKVTSIRSYQTDVDNTQAEDIVYAPEFGLAVEKPIDGVSLQDLWKIIKINK